jgi:putative ABC transport system permease protein
MPSIKTSVLKETPSSTFRTNYNEEPKKKPVLLDKLRAIPGVALVSISSNPPSSNGTWSSTMDFNDGKKEIAKTYR